MQRTFSRLLLAMCLFVPAGARAQDIDWRAVDQAFGRSGQLQDGAVYRFSMPRSDLVVTARGITIRPALSLGSWIAFKATGANAAVAMGDLVLTEAEYNRVIARLQQGGIGQTAIHKHLPEHSPGLWWTHIHAHGDPVAIARTVRDALALTGTPAAAAQPPSAAPFALDTAAIRGILGHAGRVNGGVYQVSVPRSEVIRAMGIEVPPSMGVATVINFQPTGGRNAAINGDFVMTAAEVDAVTKALREADIEVVSLHNHLTDEQPRLFFMHFWANDDAEKLARGLRAALNRTNSRPASSARPAGPPVQGAEPDLPLVERFDRNGDKRLDHAERTSAREYLAAHPELRAPARGAQNTRTGSPGARLTPTDVKPYGVDAPLYDAGTVRTLFLEFEHADWEQELASFWHTDVEVAATLTMDGRTYRDVGVSFRGNNAFTAVPEGLKRQLSIALDFVHDQDLLGYKELKLLNANQDPTFMRTPLYLEIARDYIPALKANFMRVVINGESWGVYVSQQDFDKQFTREAFGSAKGTRWKSPNNSVGGGLSYLGDDIASYRRWYEMKGSDDIDAWRALIQLCRVLNETPVEQLEQALAPILDIDRVLRFLALDIALVNSDGYWRDGSDFNIYRDEHGRFHLTPHDVNEGFRSSGRTGAASPDPLAALDDPNKALRHKLLAVPALRARYLAYVGDIAEKWLDWNRLGPIVERYRALLADDVARDTRKLDATEAFTTGIYGAGGDTPPAATTLKGFADQRRAFLVNHPDVVKARGR